MARLVNERSVSASCAIWAIELIPFTYGSMRLRVRSEDTGCWRLNRDMVSKGT